MARPRNDPGDSFGRAELALAGGMTLSNLDYLDREDHVPRGRNIQAMKRMAAIGAFMMAGIPLILSAQLANAVLLAFNQTDGEVPSNFPSYRLLDETPGGRNDYWLHKALLQSPDIYKPGKAYKSDVLIEISDRKFVRVDDFGDGLKRSDGPTPVARIEGWQRGSKPRVIEIVDELPRRGTESLEEHITRFNSEMAELNTEFANARENAVGLIVVNVSLAIRRGLDTIAEHRATRLAKRSGKK